MTIFCQKFVFLPIIGGGSCWIFKLETLSISLLKIGHKVLLDAQ